MSVVFWQDNHGCTGEIAGANGQRMIADIQLKGVAVTADNWADCFKMCGLCFPSVMYRDPRKFLKASTAATKNICKACYETFGCAGHASKIKIFSLEGMASRIDYRVNRQGGYIDLLNYNFCHSSVPGC